MASNRNQKVDSVKTRTGIGQALAELVNRLTPEEKQEFAQALSWEELEPLRQTETLVDSIEVQPEAIDVRRMGEPKIYVGTTVDGLALELPADCTATFIKHLADALSVSSIGVYLRRNGNSEEYNLTADELDEFLGTHQEVVSHSHWTMELDEATLVSGGGGCLLLSLEEISAVLKRQLATHALSMCGFDYEFAGDEFSAVVWNDKLEVTEQ